MTTTSYSGLNSPASISIRNAILIAEAEQLNKDANSIGNYAGYPYGSPDEEYDSEHAAKWGLIEAEMIDRANQLLKEAGVK